MDHSPGFLALVNAARRGVRETDVPSIKKQLDDGHRFILIDIREESEWSSGHLPGAIHLGKGIIERDIERLIPDKEASIVLYCGGGFRSVLTAESLQKMGYAHVLSMDGGWREWVERGYPTANDQSGSHPG